MTSKITELERPVRFVDEQQRGPFRRFFHEHRFEETPSGTIMHDHIEFDAPFWLIGDVVEKAILGDYLIKLIVERNEFLRESLERQ